MTLKCHVKSILIFLMSDFYMIDMIDITGEARGM